MATMSDSQPSQDSTATLTESRSEVLYFAYGSNLSTTQMLHRCPSSVPIGLGFLRGWRWIINERGYANVVPSSLVTPSTSKDGVQPLGDEEDGVYGLMYLLPEEDEVNLDVHEGVPWAYQKEVLEVDRIRDERGGRLVPAQMCKALVYADGSRIRGNSAKEEYKTRMEDGIEDAVRNYGLGERYAEGMRRWLRL